MVTKNEALKSGCTMMGFGEPNQFEDMTTRETY